MRSVRAALIACSARPAALDAVAAAALAFPCRVAPDELWLLAPPELGPETRRIAESILECEQGDALVVDQTDGWAIRALAVPVAASILAQLSAIRFPEERPAFVQGMVAAIPAKVLLLSSRVHILVPLPVAHHLDTRVAQISGGQAVSAAEDMAPTILLAVP